MAARTRAAAERRAQVILAGANNAHISQGDIVSATGTVEKAPPASQAKHQWSLDDNGVKRLQQQGVYIEGSQVQKIRP